MRQPFGLILAGGQGTRMGGVIKADIVLGGATLLSRARARLEPQVAALAVNANAPIDTDLAVLADTKPGFLGPLAGVLTGLDWAAQHDATHVVTAAVDTPFFPCDLVAQLLLAGEAHPLGLAIASTSDGLHGTFGLWPVALRSELATFLTDGNRKVRTFTERHDAALAPFRDSTPSAFFNINTPDNLKAAQQWL